MINRYTDKQKQDIIDGAREAVVDIWVRGGKLDPSRACLYMATAVGYILAQFHKEKEICIQAGTMNWPIRDDDDGFSPTHFGYEANSDDPEWVKQSEAMFGAGLMPEMHVWLVSKTGESDDDITIIDPSTGWIKHNAERVGLTWTSSRPLPDFLWKTFSDLQQQLVSEVEMPHLSYKADPWSCDNVAKIARSYVAPRLGQYFAMKGSI